MNTLPIKNIAFGIGALILIAGIAYVAYINDFSFSGGVAARVNGEEIKKSALEDRLERAKNSYTAQRVTLQDEDIEFLRQQILNDLVSETLLLQYAADQNIEVSESEIDQGYQEIISTFPSEEEFKNALVAQNMSEKELRTQISRQLIVQKVAEQKAPADSITITEEEIQQAYDDAVAAGQEVPPLEESQEDIREFLRQQKVGEVMNTFINELRSNASVEILV